MTVSINSRPGGFAAGSSRQTVLDRAKRVVQYRRILKLLVKRDLKVRYAGSALGYVWTVLDPLLMSVVYWFVFEKIFHRTAGLGFSPFMIYLVSGQLAWSWFNGGVAGVTRALRTEAQMVRSSNVPRELWVLRVVVSKGVEYLFGLPVLALFAAVYMVAPSKYIVLLPLGWALEALLLVGIGLILAPAAVLVKDLERVVPIVMRVLFYGSPVLYSINLVPAQIRDVFSYNPAVGFLTLSHAAFFPAAIHEPKTVKDRDALGHVIYTTVERNGKTVRAAQTHVEYISHWNWVWHSAIAAVIIFAIGVFVFVRLERSVLKEI
jgi:ABC-2 type transport system permease protein